MIHLLDTSRNRSWFVAFERSLPRRRRASGVNLSLIPIIVEIRSARRWGGASRRRGMSVDVDADHASETVRKIGLFRPHTDK